MRSKSLGNEVEYAGGGVITGNYAHACCSCVSYVNSNRIFFFGFVDEKFTAHQLVKKNPTF
jgi:hypothetical protein